MQTCRLTCLSVGEAAAWVVQNWTWLPVLLSLAFWLVAAYRYGQVWRLAHLHSVAEQRLRVNKKDRSGTLDSLAERRMSIIANIIQGAAFIGAAAALWQDKGALIVEPVIAALILVVAWGACNEAGVSHTFYKLSLNSKRFRRNGEYLENDKLPDDKKVTALTQTMPRRLGQWLDYFPSNTFTTIALLSLSSLVLFCWWGREASFENLWIPGLAFGVGFVIMFSCGKKHETDWKPYSASEPENDEP